MTVCLKWKISVGEGVEKLEPLWTAGENIQSPPLWKTVWWSLKKVNIELTNDVGILFLGRYASKRIENRYLNKTCTQEYS